MRTILKDAAYALRQFRRAPGFTLTAVLTLALGIGGATAIFSLMHDVMLRSLPVADPSSLHRIGSGSNCCVEGGPQDNWGMFSYPLIERLRTAAPEFAEVAAFQAATPRFSVLRTGERTALPLRGEFVSGNYFSVFGIKPFIGRLIEASDDDVSAAPVVAISYRAWQEHFGANPAVVGANITVQGQSFTVAGVAPPGFFGETLRWNPPDFWLPLHQEPLLNGSDSLLRQPMTAWLRAIGRLKPGATTNGVSDRLTALLRRWMETEAGYPAVWMAAIRELVPKQKIEIVPAGNGVEEMRDDYGQGLKILLAICVLVLLIACANVANLLIARGMMRRIQTSIRFAMGASRARLIRQTLVESVLLAVSGGVAGLLVALVALAAPRLLASLVFPGFTYMPFSTSPSPVVLAFAFGVSLLTGIVFGVGPAVLASRRDPVEALRGANRSTHDHSSFSRRALLVVQASVSVVLLAGAALLTRSLANLENQDFGFRKDGILHVSLNAPSPNNSPERLDAIYRALQDKLNAIPGVSRAALALYAPLTDNWGELVFVDGRPPAKPGPETTSSWDRVSPGYLEAVGHTILKGRSLSESDGRDSQNVAVVNEAFVRRFFPNESPLDKYFGLDLPEYSRTFRIVGVARDAKYIQPSRPARPMFFAPLAQWVNYKEELLRKVDSRAHFINSAILVTNRKPADLEPELRAAFAEFDSSLAVVNVRPMRDLIRMVFDQQRTVASLAGLFGVVALLLAAIGLYGVMAYTVVQRTNEIGLRMALGADRANVVRLMIKTAFATVAFGLILGIPLAIGAGKLLASELYGVSAWDPLALAAAIIALTLAALAATTLPALRAASIDPMSALRSD
jgi:predicted permease